MNFTILNSLKANGPHLQVKKNIKRSVGKRDALYSFSALHYVKEATEKCEQSFLCFCFRFGGGNHRMDGMASRSNVNVHAFRTVPPVVVCTRGGHSKAGVNSYPTGIIVLLVCTHEKMGKIITGVFLYSLKDLFR